MLYVLLSNIVLSLSESQIDRNGKCTKKQALTRRLTVAAKGMRCATICQGSDVVGIALARGCFGGGLLCRGDVLARAAASGMVCRSYCIKIFLF